MISSQPSTLSRSPEDRSTEFVPVQGGSDGTNAGTLLVAAYLLMWTILMGFVFVTWRRLGRTERRLTELRARLERAEPRG